MASGHMKHNEIIIKPDKYIWEIELCFNKSVREPWISCWSLLGSTLLLQRVKHLLNVINFIIFVCLWVFWAFWLILAIYSFQNIGSFRSYEVIFKIKSNNRKLKDIPARNWIKFGAVFGKFLKAKINGYRLQTKSFSNCNKTFFSITQNIFEIHYLLITFRKFENKVKGIHIRY